MKEPVVILSYMEDDIQFDISMFTSDTPKWSDCMYRKVLECPVVEMAAHNVIELARGLIELCSSYLWISRHARPSRDGDVFDVDGERWLIVADRYSKECIDAGLTTVKLMDLPVFIAKIRGSYHEQIKGGDSGIVQI